MKILGLALLVLGLGGACDGTGIPRQVSNSDAADARSDHSESDLSTDAGRLACGDNLCDATQICLYPAYGCVAFLSDSGVCPDGSHALDGGTGCVQDPPAPSCVTPAPGSGSYDCSGGNGSDCSIVNAPIPKSCSRICRDICA